MKTIVVGSENPVKLEAVRQAFERVWPDEEWQVEGVAAQSGVSDQPMSDEESIKGATNRAQQALKQTSAEYGVGLEGGLQEIEGRWFDCGWIVVVDKASNKGIGSTMRIMVPRKMMDMIRAGYELSDVDDTFLKRLIVSMEADISA